MDPDREMGIPYLGPSGSICGCPASVPISVICGRSGSAIVWRMSGAARPSVTVVVPCFNCGRFVRAAVRSALRQEQADARVVVVDDGSTDGRSPADCDACAGERVRVVHQANAGLPAARNAGARGATSEFLAFLDADDYLEPWFVHEL